MTTIPFAVQLYTLRNETERDFEGTVRKVAELGFHGVEFAGFGGLSPEKVKALLDELGLKAASSHVPLEQLKENLSQVIEEHQIIGCPYIVCPYIENREPEDYEVLIEDLKRISAICRDHGITLCYHNHDFELTPLPDGTLPLEKILQETGEAEVQAEFDIYWIQKAGGDPAAWIDRYQGRTPLIHLKDMTLDEEQFFAELGTGGVDLDTIFTLGEKNGVKWWVVEQDESRRTPMESLEISMSYVKNKFPHLVEN
ncbi:TIM barrel protein [Halobacillus litoralis]|uniref:TIM barrel protein n=1 Tax=Halobacillus litoralis TaxID=45668 RepID=A0A845DRT8_9BACI|nr:MULTISPECIES: sugar phosphate isomerase/epimerase [Halobacillus]MYL20220.1 TIM barrel protein [Halobacillus litoralis]MYL29314.1 TIM barrel protein [Halobacillus halophilus]MYL36531.1 TIM barrel protein [Halobacillus litoralis]